MTPVLELAGVRAAYGRIEVLHGVDLVVPRGCVVALLGPNGAGKTTLLRVVSGLLPATAGHVHLGGHHVNDATADEIARAGVCTVPQGRGVFPSLTVEENLRLAGFAGQAGADAFGTAYAVFPRLAERRRQQAGTLSGGEQQMLAFARALVTRPALLLVDEFSMGLAPVVVEALYDAVAGLARDGVSVLLVEQFAEQALAVADYAVVLRQGAVAAVGEPADVRPLLSGAYLGGAA